MRIHRLIVVCVMLAATACGPRLVYPNLDWLIRWYVGDFIDLDAGQKDALVERLAVLMDWHCRTQMGAYAESLRDLRETLMASHRPVTAEVLERHYRQIRQHLEDLIARAGPHAADILATASDEQIDALFQRLEAQNRKLARRYVNPPEAQLIDDRRKKMVARLEKWLGPLTPPQQQRVAEWSRQMGADARLWIDHRRRVQAAFRERLARREPSPAFAQSVVDLLARRAELQTPAYRERYQRRKKLVFNLLAQLAGTLSAEQRRHVVQRLASMAAEFDRLSCPVGTPAPSP